MSRVDFDFRGSLQARKYTPGTTTVSMVFLVWEKLTWLGTRHVRGSTLQRLFKGNHFVDFRLQVTPMSQERPHNLRGRRFLQPTPSEFVPRNLYPFCKFKDLPSRKTPGREERKRHDEAIGSCKALKWQTLHDCLALPELLRRMTKCFREICDASFKSARIFAAPSN